MKQQKGQDKLREVEAQRRSTGPWTHMWDLWTTFVQPFAVFFSRGKGRLTILRPAADVHTASCIGCLALRASANSEGAERCAVSFQISTNHRDFGRSEMSVYSNTAVTCFPTLCLLHFHCPCYGHSGQYSTHRYRLLIHLLYPLLPWT